MRERAISLLLSFFMVVAAQAESVAGRLQDEFVRVANQVSKAVVNVVSMRTVVSSGYSSPFGDDEFFCRFFPEFCEQTPSHRRKESGLGSGIIIDENGHVLTNAHVVSQADSYEITLPDGRSFKGELVGQDAEADIALLKLKGKFKKSSLPVAQLGDSSKLKVGQWVLAIGNPFGNVFVKNGEEMQPTVTVGVVSALHRSITVQRNIYGDLIQTDASINPGNSGGPLVNLKGEVIGINTAILSPSGGNIGIGFAIPINRAKRIIGFLAKGKSIEGGFLGIGLADVSERIAKTFGLKQAKGVIVKEVYPDTPADKAGLRPGDIILNFQGRKITGSYQLTELVRNTKPGTEVKLYIWRDHKKKAIKVVIGKREKEERTFTFRGMELSDLTESVRAKLRLEEKEGVVVTKVSGYSQARRLGIKSGDVIYRVGDRDISNLSEFKAYVKKHKDDTLILYLQSGRHMKFVELPPS